jgi:hypothetical protein
LDSSQSYLMKCSTKSTQGTLSGIVCFFSLSKSIESYIKTIWHL